MIRKIPFALLFLLLAAQSQAQYLLNGGFEDDTIVSNDTVPTHWSADFFGFGFTPDAHSGNSAAQIWNWYSYARGWISYGVTSSPYTDGGLPVSITPDRLTGFYKYIYGDNGGAEDSAVCEILVYSHQNFTGARDTIGRAYYKLGPQAEYSAFEVPITYTITGIPADSIVVRFLSSVAGFCTPSMECDYLYLDDLEVSAPTGVEVPLTPLPTISLYPSPSTAGFRIQVPYASAYPITLAMYDLKGSLVYQTTVLQDSTSMIEPHLPAGSYVWKALDAQGKPHSGVWRKQAAR